VVRVSTAPGDQLTLQRPPLLIGQIGYGEPCGFWADLFRWMLLPSHHTMLLLFQVLCCNWYKFRLAFQLHEGFCSVNNLKLSSKKWNKGRGHQFWLATRLMRRVIDS